MSTGTLIKDLNISVITFESKNGLYLIFEFISTSFILRIILTAKIKTQP